MQRRSVLFGLLASVVPSSVTAASGVTVDALIAELAALADAMEEDAAVQADFDRFVQARTLEPTAALRRAYTRVRLVFEAARDGGWWHLRWDITNRKPNSEEIWAQWQQAPALFDANGVPLPSATAECDELSALFAFLVHKLGVRDVGLFWPEWNHVVAVWSVTQADVTHRVVVPTSQIFLDAGASLDTRGFNPWKQKTIFRYGRKDVSGRHRIPKVLADTMLSQAWTHAFEGVVEAQRRRNTRSRQLGGS